MDSRRRGDGGTNLTFPGCLVGLRNVEECPCPRSDSLRAGSATSSPGPGLSVVCLVWCYTDMCCHPEACRERITFFFFGGGLGSVLNLIPVFSEQKKQMCYYIKLTKVFKF